MKTEIKKITIKVGGKELEFTPDEAKELKSLLTDLFGGTVTQPIYIDRWHTYPAWPYIPPTNTGRQWISNFCNDTGYMTLTASKSN